MTKVCYIVEVESSLGGLLERLDDMGATWKTVRRGVSYMEIEITAPEHLISEIENEMAWYV